MSMHTTQRLTGADLLTWLAAPAAIFFTIALACVAPTQPCPPGESCETLTPQEQENLDEAEDQLLGTWELTYNVIALDDVERPLFAGSSRWELEIFEVRSVSDTIVSWSGAYRAVETCLVNTENFESQSDTCDTLSPVELGRCSGHTCTQYTEFEIDGRYDSEEKIISGESTSGANGNMFFLNPLQGYINVASAIDFDVVIRDGAGLESTCKNDFNCRWSVDVEGLYEDSYRDYSATERTTTLNRISRDHRPSDTTIDSDKRTVTIGAQNAVDEILLGDWSVRMQIEGKDDVERPILLGDVRYTLNIFEVKPLTIVGEWEWKGGLSAESICVANKDAVENGTFECDTNLTDTMGSCSGANCTDGGEFPLTGRFNDLNGDFSISHTSNGYKDADIYHADDQGYIFASVPIDVESSLIGQVVASTPCDMPGSTACRWVVRTAGTYEDIYGDHDGEMSYFEMSR